MSHWFLTSLAPLPAVLLLAIGLWWAPTRADEREERNAGHVLGGVVVRGGVDARLDAVIARRPRVLVLGNSNANSDIDAKHLAAGLGMTRDEVAVLSIPNASAVHWLAILRRLDYRPDLVLAVSRLQLVLVRDPISEGARRSLDALLGPGDDDLRAPGGRSIAEVLQRRETLRDRTSVAMRAWLPLLLGNPKPEAMVRRALSDARVDVDLLGAPPSRPLPPPEASWVTELARTAREKGIHLVVARPPASPLAGPVPGDVVPAGYAERTRELLAAEGARWADLTALGMQPHHYQNADHLDGEGARRLTGALLALLRPPRGERVDALGAVRFVDGVLRRDTGAVVFAAPPPEIGARFRWDGAIGRSSRLPIPDDVWTQQATRLSARCSPVRVVMDGRVLGPAGVPCTELDPGTSCHRATGVEVRTPDRGEHQWTVVLDPDRTCDGARWLYPGDRAEIRWPTVPSGARLEIDVVPWEGAQVQAELQDGARGTVGAGRTLVLPTSGAPVLTLRSDGYALVTRAELVGR